MMVVPEKAAGKIEHAEKTYYFCSKSCAERFSQEPGKFLATSSIAGVEHSPPPAGPQAIEDTAAMSRAAPEEKKIRYTCPMHQQVVKVDPDTYAICGSAIDAR